MVSKVILTVCDGLGDRPIPEFGGKTPLEAATTPNLDALVSEAECGTMCALGRGVRPGSDTSHLAIMGYDPADNYPGRGPVEVAGIGLNLEHGDIAMRGNFGTVDDEWVIKDRRAGRIRDVKTVCEAIDGIEIDGVKFIVKPGTAHRAGLIMRGEGLSDKITDADPHEPDAPLHDVHATDDSPEAKHTADTLKKFFKEAYSRLKEHPFNKERESNGDLPANFLLVRGAGQYKKLEPFVERFGLKAACVAGGGLYKGVGSLLGMRIVEVPGATGLPDTDIKAKFSKALDLLGEHDFVFVHIKAADSLGEDGNAEGKRDFIARIDEAASVVRNRPDGTLFVMTADHSTPCELSQHSADPVPLMFHGACVRTDGVREFGERACAQGGLGFYRGLDLMPQVINLLGRLPLIGA